MRPTLPALFGPATGGSGPRSAQSLLASGDDRGSERLAPPVNEEDRSQLLDPRLGDGRDGVSSASANSSGSAPPDPRIESVRRLAEVKWYLSVGDIEDSDLVKDRVCHDLTFDSEPGSTAFSDVRSFLVRYNARPPAGEVMLCMKGNRVAHSATRVADDRWRQTLPQQGIFTSTADQIRQFGGYRCYVLPGQLPDVEKLATDEQGADDAALASFSATVAEIVRLCDVPKTDFSPQDWGDLAILSRQASELDPGVEGLSDAESKLDDVKMILTRRKAASSATRTAKK